MHSFSNDLPLVQVDYAFLFDIANQLQPLHQLAEILFICIETIIILIILLCSYNGHLIFKYPAWENIMHIPSTSATLFYEKNLLASMGVIAPDSAHA